MYIKFGFKKYYKYFIIALIVILCFKCVYASASTVVSGYNSVVNFGTNTDYSFTNFWNLGNSDDLIDVSSANNTYISGSIDLAKSKVVLDTNSNSFEEFESNYYYAFLYGYNVNSFRLIFNVYYVPKLNNDSFHFNLSVGNYDGINNSTSRLNIYITPSTYSTQEFSKFSIQCYNDGTNCLTIRTGSVVNNLEFNKNNNYLGFTFSSSTNTFNLNFNQIYNMNYTSGSNLYFIDSNVDNSLYYYGNTYDNATQTNYIFDTITDNLGNSYNIGDLIVSSVPPVNYENANINDLGDNSYGINVNNIVNNVISLNNSDFSSFSITCPFDRSFVNNVCTIYNTDFIDYDSTFTDINNQATFIIGSNSNLNINGSKYYILSFRLYSEYYLEPTAFIYTIGNNVYSVEDIYKIMVDDYSLYKDYYLVFSPDSSSNGSINYLSITFKSLSNLTNNLGNSYNFGIFKTIKLSQFDTMPTDADLSNNINSNSLNSIANNNNSSYFTNFSINDYHLSTILTLPLEYIEHLDDNVCSPLSFPIPFINTQVSIPCLSSVFSTKVPLIWDLYKIIINGILCYLISIYLFDSIKSVYNPDYEKIEVVDL